MIVDLFCQCFFGKVIPMQLEVQRLQLGNLSFFVECWIVVRTALQDVVFPPREMFGMDGNAVIFVGSAGLDVGEVSLLLLQVETSHVWQKDVGQCEPNESELISLYQTVVFIKAGEGKTTHPWNDVEACLRIDVVVDDSRKQGPEFSACCRETVR